MIFSQFGLTDWVQSYWKFTDFTKITEITDFLQFSKESLLPFGVKTTNFLILLKIGENIIRMLYRLMYFFEKFTDFTGNS